jgi:hypothetical protein
MSFIITLPVGYKPVLKHGDHDQSVLTVLGRKGFKVAPEIVRSTLERVKENGGLSVSLKDGSEPTKGFMVAKGKKFAAIVKADEFFDEAKGAEILSSYMKQHKSEFNNRITTSVYGTIRRTIRFTLMFPKTLRTRGRLSLGVVTETKSQYGM